MRKFEIRNPLSAILAFVVLAVGGFAQAPSSESPDGIAEKRRADTLQQRLFNYANYARYAEENSKLAPPAKGEDRVVFLGDSITEHWKLAEHFPGKPYVNRGIGGQGTSQMLIRFRPDVIALKPKVVVILAGTNDIAGMIGPITVEAIADNLASMVDLAHANGIDVVLASIIPISDNKKNKQGVPIIQSNRRPPAKILALNDRIKKLCAERKLVYLDYFSAMADDKGSLKDDLADDGLHPNANAYEVMKTAAEPAIAAALKAKRKK